MKGLILIFSLLFIGTTTAFKCYQCEYFENDNSTQGGCDAEPVEEKFLIDCGYASNTRIKDWQCVKKVGKHIDEDDNEYKYVNRFCQAGKNFENSCKESDALGSPHGAIELGFLCHCEGEGCNSASQLNLGIGIILCTFRLAVQYLF